jgi:hypothetical protein
MLGLLEWRCLGGIYSPQPPIQPLGWLLPMGAPDRPVRHRTRFGAPPDTVRCASHVTQPLGFDRWSFVFLWHRTVRCRTGQVLFTVWCASDGCAALPRTVCALFIWNSAFAGEHCAK